MWVQWSDCLFVHVCGDANLNFMQEICLIEQDYPQRDRLRRSTKARHRWLSLKMLLYALNLRWWLEWLVDAGKIEEIDEFKSKKKKIIEFVQKFSNYFESSTSEQIKLIRFEFYGVTFLFPIRRVCEEWKLEILRKKTSCSVRVRPSIRSTLHFTPNHRSDLIDRCRSCGESTLCERARWHSAKPNGAVNRSTIVNSSIVTLFLSSTLHSHGSPWSVCREPKKHREEGKREPGENHRRVEGYCPRGGLKTNIKRERELNERVLSLFLYYYFSGTLTRHDGGWRVKRELKTF